MGFTPAQVDAMSVWEFLACRDGFQADKPRGSSDDLDDDWMRAQGVEGF